jgi:Ser/Thr protein kinase RdoA (MazF antagonist)
MQEILSFLQEEYELRNPHIVKTIDRGLSAQNYLITTDEGLFFLKTYNRKRSREQIEEIQQAELFFYTHGIPAIVAVPGKNKETLLQHAGTFLALFPGIIDTELESLPSKKALSSIAALSARLHLVSKEDPSLKLTRVQDRWHRENFLRDAAALMSSIESVEEPSDFDRIAKEFLQLKMDLAGKSALRFEELELVNDTALHGDYHYHNMFFGADGNVSHIFDFERIRKGPRTTELGYGVFFNCFDINNPTIDELSETHLSLAKTYIASYRAVYPISEEEIRKGLLWFYYTHQVAVLWPLNAHYMDKDNRADKLVPKRLSRLKYFSENIEKILELAVAK